MFNHNKIMNSTLIILNIALLLAIGTVVYFLVHTINSRKWPTTEGKVLSSKVTEIPDPQDKHNTLYKADILFEYSVSGTKYSSNEPFGLLPAVSDQKVYADQTVQKYRVGESVTVYYNPGDPADSSLLSGLVFNNKGITILVIIMILAAAILELFFLAKTDVINVDQVVIRAKEIINK